MKYGSVIRELATLGANWKFYDENFRKLRQSQGTAWDQIHSELWLRSQSFRDKHTNHPKRARHEGPYIPNGYCWKFHRGVQCPGCSFKHQCFRCGQSHPIAKCQQPKQSAGPGKKPNVSNSRNTPNTSSGWEAGILFRRLWCSNFSGTSIRFCLWFCLHFQGTQQGQFSSNLQSALQYPEIVDRKLDKEICEGRIQGPFVQPQFYNLKVSPLGVIPKKPAGEYRMIHHLSFPCGDSVNDFIPSELCSVRYATVDDAVKMIKKIEPNCHLAKTDVRSAFRIIPVTPAYYYLLGMHWKGNYYVDCCLPMGLASSCRTFQMLSTALEWVSLNKLNIPHIIHILDDFLIAAESLDICKTCLQQFLTFCEDVGVPMAPEKNWGPSSVLTFKGIELDCRRNKARLPYGKVEKCLLAIRSFLGRKKVTLKELQSPIGLLNFACSAVTSSEADQSYHWN